jgi:anti-anti-sigma regulatory factor
MSPPLRHITADRVRDVTCVSLKKHRLAEDEILEMADEVVGLIDGGSRKVLLSLGPGALECLYSVFLSKLVMFQRTLRARGGSLKLCDVTPEVREVFEACRLSELFDFTANRASGLAAFAREGGQAGA